MSVFIAFVVGVACGYGFRGLINKFGKKAEAEVKTEATTVINNIKAKL